MRQPHPRGSSSDEHQPLRFYGGVAGALTPFALFLAGVCALGLSGAPDERGFWPILLVAMIAGLVLARDREAYSESLIRGMTRPLVTIMILAWLLAGALGAILQSSGFVEALSQLARALGMAGSSYTIATFLICCLVSTAIGTSIGTILVCGPLLYPAGAGLGVDPDMLMAAVLAGATFGDNISPISDTTIASALTQNAPMARVVRSRMKYAIPAASAALVAFFVFGGSEAGVSEIASTGSASLRPLVMAIVPAWVLALLIRGRHLLQGLLFGVLGASAVGLAASLITPSDLMSVNPARFRAEGILLDGLERGIGASIFTLLLMGLIGSLEATGLVERLVALARRRTRSVRGSELWIATSATLVALLTTHSTVAILTTGDFARRSGERYGIAPERRANLLDLAVCTFPFLLPYMIPVILAASATAGAESVGMPRLSPLSVGLYNFYAWGILVMLWFSVITGFGGSPSHAVVSPEIQN